MADSTHSYGRGKGKAKIIHAPARIEISEIEQRALIRMVREEGRKQENIESITAKAIPSLSLEAAPEGIEKFRRTGFACVTSLSCRSAASIAER